MALLLIRIVKVIIKTTFYILKAIKIGENNVTILYGNCLKRPGFQPDLASHSMSSITPLS